MDSFDTIFKEGFRVIREKLEEEFQTRVDRRNGNLSNRAIDIYVDYGKEEKMDIFLVRFSELIIFDKALMPKLTGHKAHTFHYRIYFPDADRCFFFGKEFQKAGIETAYRNYMNCEQYKHRDVEW